MVFTLKVRDEILRISLTSNPRKIIYGEMNQPQGGGVY